MLKARKQSYLGLFICFLSFYCLPLHAIERAALHTKSQVGALAVPHELLVKFKRGKSIKRSKAVRYKASLKKRFQHLNVEHWKLDSTQNYYETLKELRQDPSVEFAEPNIRRFPRPYIISKKLQTRDSVNQARLAQVNLPKLWDDIPIDAARTTKVRVAVLDDAFDIDHPEYAENIVFPFDALDSDDDPSPETCPAEITGGDDVQETHGTLVLGVLAAKGIELAGAADHAEFIPIRLGCEYLLSAELAAYEHAISNNVDIINLSWGGPLYSELERDAIYQLGQKDILIVIAAGNAEVDNDRIPDYPSSIDLPNILSVAATDENNTLTHWTQYGATSVDIAAPGENFYTTRINGSYGEVSGGTSFSAPLVAGVVASLMVRDASSSVYDVKAALMASAEPFANALIGRLVVDGYVNASAAFEFLSNRKDEPVIVIHKVEIDDSNGNKNGEIDGNEDISLKITLENINADANSIALNLLNNDTGLLSLPSEISSIPGIDQENLYSSRIETAFGVDFNSQVGQQNILFSLEGRGFLKSGEPLFFSRSFTIDTGRLTLNTPINNEIRQFGNDQDDFHYYYVDVPAGFDRMNIILESGSHDLDMIVKKDSAPRFDYLSYWDTSIINEGAEDGAMVAAYGFQGEEKIVINAPEQGTYHIVVVTPENSVATDINYTLEANIHHAERISDDGIFGLSLSILLLFTLVFLLFLLRFVQTFGVIIRKAANNLFQ